MNKILVYFVTVCCLMMLGACGKADVTNKGVESTNRADTTEENRTEDNKWSQTKVEKSISEWLNVNADIIVPENFAGVADKYEMELVDFEAEDIFEAFELNPGDFTSPNENTYFNDDFAINIGTTYFSFHTASGDELENLYFGDEYRSSQNELAFESPENAAEAVLNFITEKLKMDYNFAVEESFVIDPESEKLFNDAHRESIDLKTGEVIGDQTFFDDIDGAYCLKFGQIIDGIFIEPDTMEKNGIWMPGFTMKCIYSENGIEYLIMDAPINVTNKLEAVNVVDIDTVLDKLTEKFDNMIMTTKYEVSLIQLEYKSTTDMRLIPVWKVTMWDDEYGYDYQVWFDAETGIEIV